MWSFRNNRLLDPVDVTAANLLSALGRHQGRQDLFTHQVPQVLDKLRKIAVIESTEASNRIEGITVSPDRLKALMAQAEPQTRPESEIAGYRDVLARIHTGQLRPPVTTALILSMHAGVYSYLRGEGGQWKQRDNVIRQTLADGREVIRFVPLSAEETPEAMEELCHRLGEVWDAGQVDKLLIINAFILDFLCVHPFADGNGRVARLLTMLLLYAAGYEVGRYISLERTIEQTKETYYEALRMSSERWDAGQHNLTPWHQYSLSVIVHAYREFEQQVGDLIVAPGAKGESVRAAIATFSPGRIFMVGDLERICPMASRTTIKRVLDELRAAGQVKRVGQGRTSQWQKLLIGPRAD